MASLQSLRDCHCKQRVRRSADRQTRSRKAKLLSAPNPTGNDRGPQDWEIGFSKNLRIIALWGSVAAVGVLSTLVIWFVVRTSFETWQSIVQTHFLATMGLTGFGIVAFAVVVFLRNTEGPLEFEVWGLKFKGASGQAVIWAFCVVVQSLCAKLLW